MEEVTNEKNLKDYPLPTFIKGTKIILNQMQKSIAQINIKDGTQGTGFFCKIPISENKKSYIYTLISNYHVIKDETEIGIKINDGKINQVLNIENNLKYINIEQDIIFIELNEELKDSIEYLELDENVMNNSNLNYVGKSIYIIHYPNNFEEEKVAVSYGLLKKIFDDKKYNFIHYSATDFGSSGAPIFNLSNNKIIGVHKQRSNNKEYNIGFFLYDSIKEFINKYLKKETIKNIKLEKKDKAFFQKLFNNGLIKDFINIKGYDNEHYNAFKFLCWSKNMPKDFSTNSNDWITAWHGTNILNLESILKYGLKPQDTKLDYGKFVPKTKYVPKKELVLGIKNWEKAIFASSSLFLASEYSTGNVYMESHNFEECYTFILEVKIKPKSFSVHKNKEIVDYMYSHFDDPSPIYKEENIYRIPNEKNIFVNSIIFVYDSILEDIKWSDSEKEREILRTEGII